MVNYQIDQIEKFAICTFTDDTLGVYLLQNGKINKRIVNLDPDKVVVDQNACCFAKLDSETDRIIDIYILNWDYQVIKEEKPQQMMDL